MARLVGVDLPREKRAEVALTYIFGVGRTTAQKALAATDIDSSIRVKDLSDEQLVALRDYLEANVQLARSLPTSAARSRSAPTRGCGTAVVSRFAVSAPRPTLGPARAPSAPSQARRRPETPRHHAPAAAGAVITSHRRTS